jgi:hypothetical protein
VEATEPITHERQSMAASTPVVLNLDFIALLELFGLVPFCFFKIFGFV